MSNYIVLLVVILFVVVPFESDYGATANVIRPHHRAKRTLGFLEKCVSKKIKLCYAFIHKGQMKHVCVHFPGKSNCDSVD